MSAQRARWSWRVVAAALAVACAATLAFAVLTMASRPLDGSEGNFLFDAARIRQGLPLYVDPDVGAWDYGPVPSRYFVLYAPLWAAWLAGLPASVAPFAARLASLAAWVGVLGGIVVAAPRSRRAETAFGAAFVLGLYPLTLFAASGRPDALAVAMTGVALLRSLRRGRVGAVEGALFALAPFFKPNVFAAGLGAIAADCLRRRRSAWPALAGAAACALACAGALQIASRGAWVAHLLGSTWMPYSPRLWAEQVASRAPFLTLPLAYAAWRAIHAKDEMAISALASSVAWTLASLAKVGSASNYWMEPCVVGVVVLATVSAASLPMRLQRATCIVAVAQVIWTGVAAVRSSIEAIRVASPKSAAIAAARRACGARADDLVMADEAGLEVALDGRVLEQPLILTERARRGIFPLATWIDDVRRPEVACLVMQSPWLEPGAGRDPDHDLFPEGMRGPLRARFERVSARDGLWIYKAR